MGDDMEAWYATEHETRKFLTNSRRPQEPGPAQDYYDQLQQLTGILSHERARRERLEAALKRVRALCWCQPPMKEPCPICKALEDQE